MLIKYCVFLKWLILIGVATVSAEKSGTSRLLWTCSGSRETTYTNSECHVLARTSPGCYYHHQYDRYRSCSRQCNNVRVATLTEMACKSRCPGYLTKYCSLNPVTTTSTATTNKMAESTQPTVANLIASEEMKVNGDVSLAALVTGAAVIVVLSAVTVTLLYVRSRKSGGNSSRRLTNSFSKLLPASNVNKSYSSSSPVQLCTEISHQDVQPESDSNVKVIRQDCERDSMYTDSMCTEMEVLAIQEVRVERDTEEQLQNLINRNRLNSSNASTSSSEAYSAI